GHVDTLAAEAKVGVSRRHKGAVKFVNKGLVGIAFATAQLMIEMGEDKRRWWRAAQGKQSAEQGDTIGSSGDGDHHSRRLDPEPAQAALYLDDQWQQRVHGDPRRAGETPALRTGAAQLLKGPEGQGGHTRQRIAVEYLADPHQRHRVEVAQLV